MTTQPSGSSKISLRARRQRIVFSFLFFAAAALLGAAFAAASPTAPEKAPAAPEKSPASAPRELGPVPIEGEDFAARADAWYTAPADDKKGRRAEMRPLGAALKQPCRYCHTRDFKSYTDRLDISRQMMALSAEHKVACADCHAGKRAHTELGQQAQRMWLLSHEEGVFCEACHTPGAQFKELTDQGARFKEERWPAWEAAHPLPRGGDPAPIPVASSREPAAPPAEATERAAPHALDGDAGPPAPHPKGDP